jgi:hypothetical protein
VAGLIATPCLRAMLLDHVQRAVKMAARLPGGP